jgi:hypothetical protein
MMIKAKENYWYKRPQTTSPLRSELKRKKKQLHLANAPNAPPMQRRQLPIPRIAPRRKQEKLN